MSKIGDYFRIIFGLFLLLVGMGIVIADVWFMYRAYLMGQNFDPHWLHIILGVLIAFTGGYLMAPTLVEKLGAFLDTRFGKYVPTSWIGGRRSTDPPANPRNSKPVSVVPDEHGKG